MAKDETEEVPIGKNSTEALAFLASLDPSNFPSTSTIEYVQEIKVPGYILEYFLDFIRKLYFKAKVDTAEEAPLASGLPLSSAEEKLNTLLKGLEERDDDYFTTVPFPLTTIRAEKDPLSVAGETPLPELLQELYLDVASQFAEQKFSLSSSAISLDSGSTKSSSSTSSASSLSISSEASTASTGTVTRTSIELGYTRPNLERLRKIIYECIEKAESEFKLVTTSSSLSQVIELMPPDSTVETSASHSSKAPSAAGSTSSRGSNSRSTQTVSQSAAPAPASVKVESVEVPTEEKESSSSLVTVKMLTWEPSITDMSPPEMNKFAVEIYMTRFYDLPQKSDSAVMPFVEKLLMDSRLDSREEIVAGLKVVKDTAETETLDIFKFSNEQVKILRTRAQKNFKLMSKAKNLRDIKCLKRIKDSGKVVSLRAI